MMAGSSRELRFGGQASVWIPAGAQAVSDPVDFAVAAGTDLAITLRLGEPAVPQTGHPGSRATSFIAQGAAVDATQWPAGTKFTRWLHLSDVEVFTPRPQGVVVLAGDSITDGFGIQPETNLRWSDFLATRLRETGRSIGGVNAGLGSGRRLRDGLGPQPGGTL